MKSTLKPAAILFAAAAMSALPSCATEEPVEPPFEPTLESLEAHYQTPEWFKDAKFGIFAHWGPQCEPESGDWYARNMYIPNEWQFRRHQEKYGDQKEIG
ncbi:MAG: alpha-L-fucosidase, partial [Victivallales bacterium]|nr:alpha-L-fucosidase [Victivallales bacterium]